VAYALDGQVTLLDHPDPRVLQALVRGNARQAYRVTVRTTSSGADPVSGLHTTCTCPVGVSCKHAAAAICVAAESGWPSPDPPPESPWDETLRSLRSRPAAPAATDEKPLFGLRFEPVVSEHLQPSVRGPAKRERRLDLVVEPVKMRKDGEPGRTTTNWYSLDSGGYPHSPYGARRSRPTPGQEAVVARLADFRDHLRSTTRRDRYDPYGTVSLGRSRAPDLWERLGELRRLGVPLYFTRGAHAPVDMVEVPAVAAVHLVEADGGLVVHPEIAVGDEVVHPDHSVPFGEPVQAIAWWDAGGSTQAGLRIARLAGPVSAEVLAVVRAGDVAVPGGAVPEFFERYFPALREELHVIATDDVLALANPVPRVLRLHVERRGAGAGLPAGVHLVLRWSWVHEGATDPAGTPITSRRADPATDADEQRLLGAVADLVVPPRSGPSPDGPTQALLAHSHLFDGEAARFVHRTVPRIAALPGVDVHVDPDVPAFREATGAPEVSVVEVPAAGRGRGRSARAAQPGDVDWFDLRFVVTIDGEEVPFADLFRALATGDDRLALPSGTYFSLDRPELEQLAGLIEEAGRISERDGDTVRVSRLQISWWEELERLGVTTEQAGAWVAQVASLRSAHDGVAYAAPESLEASLRAYQLDGFRWLAFLYENGLGGMLGDDMGLGKTVQALALVAHADAPAPFLVVTPTSVVGNWESECRRFLPTFPVLVVESSAASRGESMVDTVARTGARIVVTSYARLRLDPEDFEAQSWAGVFVDEAQVAKNRATQIYKVLRQLPCPTKVALTGTPLENNLAELWALLSIVAPGLLPPPEQFGTIFRNPIEHQGDREQMASLKQRIRPFLLRRTKEQVATDLPAKLEQVLEVDLVPRHRKLYDTQLQRERTRILGLVGDITTNRLAILRSLTVLRQAALDMGLVDERYAKVPSAKLEEAADMVCEIAAEGHRVLVFSQFTRFLGAAERRVRAAGVETCYLDGRTRNRTKVINRFKEGTAPAFFISLKAGGFGLNLTEADYCILLDPWWNPAAEAQAVDRTHRIGQTRNVMVYRMVSRDTIEEKVMALRDRKARLFTSMMDGGEFTTAGLSAADIRALLS
jgi:hypothetical protein